MRLNFSGIVTLSVLGGCSAIFGLDRLSFDGASPTSGAGGAAGVGAGNAVGKGSGGMQSPASSSSSASASTGGGGGMTAKSCWSLGPTWSELKPFDRSKLKGTEPTNMQLSGDGLRLYYAAKLANNLTRDFVATRASRADTFSGGELVGAWPLYNGDAPSQPWVDNAATEMMLGLAGGVTLDLGFSKFVNGAWTDPQPLPGFTDQTLNEADPALALGGQRLFFWRNDGASTAFGKAAQIYEVIRGANGTFDAAVATAVALSPFSKSDHLYCPAIDESGKRLFLASTYPKVLDMSNYTTAVRVFYAERTTVKSEWGAAVQLPLFDAATMEACPLAVSADGCELWIEHWSFSGGTQNVLVAKRTPPP